MNSNENDFLSEDEKKIAKRPKNQAGSLTLSHEIRNQMDKEIISMLLDLRHTNEIKEVISEKYGHTEGSIANYITDCRKFIRANYSLETKEDMIIKHVNILEDVIRKSKENGDMKNLIKAIETIHAISFDKSTILANNMTQNVLNVSAIDSEKLEELLSKLEKNSL